jgi:hypothetical protein
MVERGTKRKCASCGASYYDLNRTPIKCPKCDAPFVAVSPVRNTPLRGRVALPPAPPPVDVEAEVEEEHEGTAEGAEEFEETEDLPSDDENFGAAGDEDEDRD